MLEEHILNEGPDLIASIMMESIVGAGGCLIMLEEYMQGVWAICDKYGILMHLDEAWLVLDEQKSCLDCQVLAPEQYCWSSAAVDPPLWLENEAISEWSSMY